MAARIEMPRLSGNSSEIFVVHKTAPSHSGGDSVVNYAYAYDKREYHSKWVAFRFDGDTRPRRVNRKDNSIRPLYPRDPKLPVAYALHDDVSFNGYDHGHLCASADRLYSREANDQTFYLGNLSPQNRQFNREYWVALEQHVQNLGRKASFADTLYVVKGGTINTGNILRHVASNRMAVPKYYFMALLKVKNGIYTGIGFLLENKDYGIDGTLPLMAGHAMSIRSLEQRTGIDFFHNLPDVIENGIENTFSLTAWHM